MKHPGKIMRRILRKIAENQIDQIGDVSTLADPGVVSRVLLEQLAVPFEIVSLLLTVAMIGAVMLAKRNLAESPASAEPS